MCHRQGISIKSRVASILSNFSFPSKGGIRALGTQCHTPTHHLPETFPHQTTLFILVPIFSIIQSGNVVLFYGNNFISPRHSATRVSSHFIIRRLTQFAGSAWLLRCHGIVWQKVLSCEESEESQEGMSYDQHRSLVALSVTCVWPDSIIQLKR